MQTKIPDIPIWDSPLIKVSFKMAEYSKKITSPTIFQSKFTEINSQDYNGFCQIYTDGSKCNEKTGAAYHGEFGTRSYRLNNNSSVFTAEVEAIRRALKYIKISHLTKFVIFSDSKSVLESIQNQASKNPLVNDLHENVYDIINAGVLLDT